MKIFSYLTVLCGALLLCGCETFRSDVKASVKEKISGPSFREHSVAATPRATFDAVKASATIMGYRMVRGGPAQGLLEALSDVRTSDTVQSARQIRLQVRVTGSDNQSLVSALFTEVQEGDFSKESDTLTTERALRDTSLYDVLFAHVDQTVKK